MRIAFTIGQTVVVVLSLLIAGGAVGFRLATLTGCDIIPALPITIIPGV